MRSMCLTDRTDEARMRHMAMKLQSDEDVEDAVRYLLREEAFDISPNEIFTLAAEINRPDVMDLLSGEFKVDIDYYWPIADGTPLSLAAAYGSGSAARWLLDRRVDVDNRVGESEVFPLWLAAMNGHLPMVAMLCDAGANLDQVNSKGNTPLFMASQNGHRFVVQELLRRGADLNKARSRLACETVLPTPLNTAASMGHADVMALLMSRGAEMTDMVTLMMICTQLEKSGSIFAQSGKTRKVDLSTVDKMEDIILTYNLSPHSEGDMKEVYGLERRGKFKEALRRLVDLESKMLREIGPPPIWTSGKRLAKDEKNPQWTRLLFDEQRLVETIYGFPKSDRRLSFWRAHAFDRGEPHPTAHVMYAWARHDNTIYRHGGRQFLGQVPSLFPDRDQLWALDVNLLRWRSVPTSGSSPGPRSEHACVIHGDALYVCGGRHASGPAPMKMFKLDLQTFQWSIVKAKGAPPSSREEFAMCVYGDKIYIHGGNEFVANRSFKSELWSLDLRMNKWAFVSGGGASTPRKAHQMFAYRNRLYVFGGTNQCPHSTHVADQVSIRAFESFDLETKVWEKMYLTGDDPWPIAEYCMFPCYGDNQPYDPAREPSSMLIFGGYCASTRNDRERSDRNEYAAKYGDSGVPYRARLLRLDLETMTWIVLETTPQVLPRAQCIAAEISTSSDGVTELIIGSGYGMVPKWKESKYDPLVEAMYAAMGIEREPGAVRPEFNYDLYRVEIDSSQGPAFFERARQRLGWEWELYERDDRPVPKIDMHVCSPTMHFVADVVEDDFRDPPYKGNLLADNEINAIGRRVVLQGLKGRSDLNGKTGRCGPWVPDRGRYFVTILKPRGYGQKPRREYFFLKPENLVFAKKQEVSDLIGMVQRGERSAQGTYVLGMWGKSTASESACPLDLHALDRAKGLALVNDWYRGPLSGRALAVLDYCCVNAKASGSKLYDFTLARFPPQEAKSEETRAKNAYYEKFLAEMIATDTQRVTDWQERLLAERNVDEWSEYVRLSVSMDAMDRGPKREIVVSTQVTIDELHQQILCPVLGFSRGFHAFAIRRVLHMDYKSSLTSVEAFEANSLRKLEVSQAECWVGPSRSTAVDFFFLPLYIGGALADERSIMLGDLCYATKPTMMEGDVYDLQYVYDFGCWWSHTIQVEPCDPPPNQSVAHLVSGSGFCPLEDTEGPHGWCSTMASIFGRKEFSDSNGDALDQGMVHPDTGAWYTLVYDELRGKSNSNGLRNPVGFDLEQRRLALREGLRAKLEKPGKEYRKMAQNDFKTGLSSAGMPFGSAGTRPLVKKTETTNPRSRCGLCGVTAGLKMCSGCDSIAFCCREHQLKFWPRHKKECKAIQKQRKR